MVSSVRRRGIRGVSPDDDTLIVEGDVLVVQGIPANLELAEHRLLKGG
jgi:CPA2 family monovalent cation:H+ antiporter-2